MKEKVKKDENQPATTSLAINLEQHIEQNMIELSGEVVTRPSFYWIDGDGASGSELPTLMMAIPMMVKRASEGYAIDRIPSTTPGAEPPRDARDSGSARSHSTHLETSSSNRP